MLKRKSQLSSTSLSERSMDQGMRTRSSAEISPIATRKWTKSYD